MSEYQEQCTSFPFMTASLFSLILMILMMYPIDYFWKSWFPNFRSLPKHIRRHDANLLLRAATGPPMLTVTIYLTVKTFQELDWFLENRTFISYWILVFLMLDLFDLSQRRKFQWQPNLHHICQIIYAVYLFEWSPYYGISFPSLGLVIMSLGGRTLYALFPLRRVAPSEKMVITYAKFNFWIFALDVTAGLAVMIALIVRYQDNLPLAAMIGQPAIYVFFQCRDVPFYTFIYKTAYPKPNQEEVKVLKKEETIECSITPGQETIDSRRVAPQPEPEP